MQSNSFWQTQSPQGLTAAWSCVLEASLPSLNGVLQLWMIHFRLGPQGYVEYSVLFRYQLLTKEVALGVHSFLGWFHTLKLLDWIFLLLLGVDTLYKFPSFDVLQNILLLRIFRFLRHLHIYHNACSRLREFFRWQILGSLQHKFIVLPNSISDSHGIDDLSTLLPSLTNSIWLVLTCDEKFFNWIEKPCFHLFFITGRIYLEFVYDGVLDISIDQYWYDDRSCLFFSVCTHLNHVVTHDNRL